MVNIPVFMTYLILLWSHVWTTDQINCRTHTKLCVEIRKAWYTTRHVMEMGEVTLL